MRADEIWEEFLRTRDIARAGQMILEFIRLLKHDIISFLKGGRERKVKPKRREVRLLNAELIMMHERYPPRYPSLREFMEALEWAQSKVRERREYLRLVEISEFNLAEHVSTVRSAISELKREGKLSLSLAEISKIAGGLVMTLLALLFLEKEGEIVLAQEKPFGEVRVILNADREILGESQEVV
ncbi:MAG: hypothetical protein NZ992_05250 [Candidatus Korarchaeum sp.]|nr:hypothetical protein [Candidatus Korarchaeum sp.]MDW8035558.1 hypothetical protein [Candidatus Korarchaeum sp.]